MVLEEQNIMFVLRATQQAGTENVVLQLCEFFMPLVNKIVVVAAEGFNKQKLEIGDVIYIRSLKKKKRQAKDPETGKWKSIPNTVVWWVEDYRMANASDELKPIKGEI